MEFAVIFTEMSWIAAVLLCVGLVFMLIEVLMPGFGFFGIGGTALLIAGIVVRIVQGLNVLQSISLILMVLGCVLVLIIIMVIGAQTGLFGGGLFENKSTLSKNYNEADRSLKKLVGKSGKTLSVLNLGGKAKINGKVYDVLSIGSYIEANTNIKVVEIKNNTIMVRKWFE